MSMISRRSSRKSGASAVAKPRSSNTGFRAALESLLREMMSSPENPYPYGEADALAIEWFSNKQAKNKVSAIFRRFHLDEFAVVAQATKKSLSDLEWLDRMLASLEFAVSCDRGFTRAAGRDVTAKNAPKGPQSAGFDGSMRQ
jgi:hypothetical protein